MHLGTVRMCGFGLADLLEWTESMVNLGLVDMPGQMVRKVDFGLSDSLDL